MFQDIGVSKDLNEQFKKHLTNSEPLDCEYPRVPELPWPCRALGGGGALCSECERQQIDQKFRARHTGSPPPTHPLPHASWVMTGGEAGEGGWRFPRGAEPVGVLCSGPEPWLLPLAGAAASPWLVTSSGRHLQFKFQLTFFHLRLIPF